MTKKEQKVLEGAMARVEDAVALLEDAQETLVHADPKFEFPVGMIFSAQTSLRVVLELAKDVEGAKGSPKKKATRAKKRTGRKAR